MTEHRILALPQNPKVQRATAPKARREREPVFRFEEIVDAAARLFSEKGYAATSIQEIADAVGLLKGSLYHYINSKEDLLHAVILEAHRQTAQLGADALAFDGDAPAKLALIVRRHLTGEADGLAKVQVFYSEAAALPADRLAEILADRANYEHAIRQILASGQEEGTVAAHLDPTLTGIAILAILNSVQQWFRPSGPRTLEEIIATFTDLIHRMVAGEPVATPPAARRRRAATTGTTATPANKRARQGDRKTS